MQTTFLQGLWFVLIGVLWAGFFVLEGFDFGVGMLVRWLGHDEVERRSIIHTIGPVWDGNEVWLLTAGGATFAAFPGWYSSTFSGFYLALFLVLASLIVRGVSFEFWGKVDSDTWRAVWEWAMGIASGLAALLFGVAWANFVVGLPMGPDHIPHATLWDLLHPYALLGGVTFVLLFLLHGTTFVTLKTLDPVRDRARTFANRLAPATALVTIGFLIWTAAKLSFSPGRLIFAVVAGIIVAVIPVAVRRSEGAGFAATALGVVGVTIVLAVALFPNALPSTTNHLYDLSLATASSSPYTLGVMTIVAFVMVPIVLAYQSWSYWVFRFRLGREDFEGPGTPNPLTVLEQKFPQHDGGSDGSTGAPAAG